MFCELPTGTAADAGETTMGGAVGVAVGAALGTVAGVGCGAGAGVCALVPAIHNKATAAAPKAARAAPCKLRLGDLRFLAGHRGSQQRPVAYCRKKHSN